MAQDSSASQASGNANKDLGLSKPFSHIFKDYLESSASTSPGNTARAVDASAPEGGQDQADQFIWETWNSFFQAVQHIPYANTAQDKLVKAVRELALLPKEDRKQDWETLPQLGWVARDWFNRMPFEKHAQSENAAETLGSWININAFLARLGGTGVHSTLDFAIWSLRQALENEESTGAPTLLDCHIQAAAQYVEYEGHILRQRLSLGWKPREAEAQMFKGGALFDGEPGLSDERWKFWISRFRELADQTTTDEAKSAALRAAKLLDIWSSADV
ncbi:hypothetical protein SCUP234_12483 [Seiridium cupressi]